MCADLAPRGIQVNGIGPGYFATELTAALVADEDFGLDQPAHPLPGVRAESKSWLVETGPGWLPRWRYRAASAATGSVALW